MQSLNNQNYTFRVLTLTPVNYQNYHKKILHCKDTTLFTDLLYQPIAAHIEIIKKIK